MLGGLEFAFWALVIVLAGIVAAALVAWFAWSNVRGYG